MEEDSHLVFVEHQSISDSRNRRRSFLRSLKCVDVCGINATKNVGGERKKKRKETLEPSWKNSPPGDAPASFGMRFVKTRRVDKAKRKSE